MHAAAYDPSTTVQRHHNLKQFSNQGTYESLLENHILGFEPIIFPLPFFFFFKNWLLHIQVLKITTVLKL